MSEKKATRVAYGEYLIELAKKYENLVVLDADLAHATMTNYFKVSNPERFFDIGIAEANMVNIAGGMANMGQIPFCSTFAVFAGRCYDQIRNGVCYPKLNVKFAFTHAGITVGEDGGSHQAVEDIALMRALPNMTVMVPSDANETRHCMDAAMKISGPVYIRLARLPSPIMEETTPFEFGKLKLVREGKEVLIVTCGLMVAECLKAAEILSEKGVEVTVTNAHTIKPFDEMGVQKLAQTHKNIFSVEEHNVIGGLGDACASALVNVDGVRFTKIGLQDEFGQSGKPTDLLKYYELDAESIANKILKSM